MANAKLTIDINANISEFKSDMAKVGTDSAAMQKVVKKSLESLAKSAKDYPENFKEAVGYAKELYTFLEKIGKQKGPFTVAQQAKVQSLTKAYQSATLKQVGAPGGTGGQIAKDELAAIRLSEKAVNDKAKAEAKQAAAKAKMLRDEENGLIRARYALYDTSASVTQFGLATLGAAAYVVKLGADFERAFADVERTTGLANGRLNELKTSLLDIATSMPIAFGQVSQIATLGAQMGIASDNVAAFSKTVSQFSTVTGVTVDNSAQSFGRLAEILNLDKDNFDQLASSILYAGRNSVATEGEILALATQIGASATQAGFAESQVIGLSTALASLRIPPEQARGVLLRLFADFDKTVSESGQNLNDFASLLGVTGDAAANLWSTDASAFFSSFVNALSRTQQAGGDLNVTLRQLGIVETREINVLQRLAGNTDLLRKSMADAGMAYSEGTDLASQYSIVAETLDQKIVTLGNSLNALLATSGQTMGDLGLKTVVDTLTRLTNFLRTSGLSSIISLGLILGAGAAAVALYRAAIMRSIASVYAFRTAQAQLDTTVAASGFTLKSLIAEFKIAELAMKARTLETEKAIASGQRLAAIETELTAIEARRAGILSTEASALTARNAAESGSAIAGAGNGVKSLTGNIDALIPKVKAFGVLAGKVFVGFAALTAVSTVFDIIGKSIEEANMKRHADDVERTVEAYKALGYEASKLAELQAGSSGRSSVTGPGGFIADSSAWQSDVDVITGANKSLYQLLDTAFEFASFGLVNTTFDEATASVSRFNDVLINLAKGGNLTQAASLYGELRARAEETGATQAELNEMFGPYIEATQGAIFQNGQLSFSMQDAAESGTALSEVISTQLTEAFLSAGRQESDFVGAIRDFAQSLKDADGSIDVTTDKGSKAFDAYGKVIEQVSKIAGNDFRVALAGAASAIQMIEAQGGNAQPQIQGLVGQLNSVFNLNLNGSTITSMAQLRNAIKGVQFESYAARMAVNQLLGSNQFTDLFKGIFDDTTKAAGSSAKKIKKSYRSVFDYISDLSGVFDNITRLTYSSTQASDDYAKGWLDIANNAKQAKDRIAEANQELADAQADKAVIEYQLKISQKYGDTLRAKKLQSDLDKLNKKITKSTEDKTDAESESSMSLTAGTSAAIANRAAVLGQVESIQKMIEAYALTTKDSKLIAGEAKRLAGDFKDQGLAAGFTESELQKYVDTINGFATAASKIKPEYDTKVTVNVVSTAIDDYQKKLKDKEANTASVGVTGPTQSSMEKVWKKFQDYLDTISFKVTLNYITGTVPTPPANSVGPLASGYVFKTPATAAARAALKAYQDDLAKAKTVAAKTRIQKSIDDLKKIYQFADGGYVSGPGTATSDSIPAFLSNGEYVMSAKTVSRYGLDFMNSLNKMQPSSSSSGAVASAANGSSVVYLSPEDRSLLRAAADRPIALYTENTKIAQSANAGNVVLAQRGTN